MNSKYHYYKGVILFVVVLFFSTNDLKGQGGLHIYAGSTSLKNALEQFTPEGLIHSGFHAGGDFSFAGQDMYFILGVQYHQIDMVPGEEFSLTDPQAALSVIKPRVGLGFNVFKINDLFKLRLKILGSLDSFFESEESVAYNLSNPLNSGTVSGIGGLGISVGPARLDVEYHRGLINAYNEIKGSQFSGLVFNAGIFF